MEKLSACMKRASSIHFFSSTRMRCIMAICPAGPPKLMQPIFSQTPKASPKLGLARACTSMSRHLGRPVVPFAGGKAQPGEQRIIDTKALLQQAMVVVASQRGKSERDGMQARRFRREVGPRRVGPTHDQRKPRKRRLFFEPEQPEHGVERAAGTLVRQL